MLLIHSKLKNCPKEPVIVIPFRNRAAEWDSTELEDVDLTSLVLYVSTSDSKINQITVFPFGTESFD